MCDAGVHGLMRDIGGIKTLVWSIPEMGYYRIHPVGESSVVVWGRRKNV
jgi:hypothetical protein